MMNSLKALGIALMATIVMVGCSKVEKILPKNDGVWRVTSETFRYYTNGNLDTTEVYTNSGDTYTFSDDGTVESFEAADNSTTSGTWEVNEDQSEILLCNNTGVGNFCLTFNVVESTKSMQTWTTTVSTGTQSTEIDLVLER